jgi:hypothetical protein
MKTLNTIGSVLEALAYTVLALPFIGLIAAVIYGLAKHTFRLLYPQPNPTLLTQTI